MRQAARYRFVGQVLLSGFIASGCGSPRPHTTLSPYSFRRPASTMPADAMSLPPLPARRESLAPAVPAAAAALTPSITAGPASRPTVGTSSAQYQTVGGVVSEVNGIPIYANKVLRLLRAALAAKAMELDSDQFRRFATVEIAKTINGLERAELIFGAAERSLADDDKRMAEFMTMQWRTQQITEAGGSPEMAANRAREQGYDFDEMVFERYREFMTKVYLRKNIVPRIQISAQDMREYYTANLEREFTDRGEVTFRLIKIDFAKNGGQDAAISKARRIIEQARTTAFSELASTMNDDPRLALRGGLELPVEKNAYRLEKVEKAMWEAPIGGIVGPVQDGTACYVGMLQSRKEGNVEPFGSPSVQDRIYEKLWGRQIRTMTDKVDDRLRAQNMVRRSSEMFDTALQMAMQNYSRWARGEMDMQ